MALTGDVIDARTALDWGLVNRVVPPKSSNPPPGAAERVTRGRRYARASASSFYAQIDMDQPKAYAYAVEMMAATSQLPDARNGCGPSWRSASRAGGAAVRTAARPGAQRPGSGPSSTDEIVRGARGDQVPSTTVASSTQSVPALIMSSRIAVTLIARRPLRIFAEIGTRRRGR